MANKRANFSPETKRIIPVRSAYRCCFPDCDSNSFQTIAAMHTIWEGVDWSGWNMAKMTKDNIDIKWDLLH